MLDGLHNRQRDNILYKRKPDPCGKKHQEQFVNRGAPLPDGKACIGIL